MNLEKLIANTGTAIVAGVATGIIEDRYINAVREMREAVAKKVGKYTPPGKFHIIGREIQMTSYASVMSVCITDMYSSHDLLADLATIPASYLGMQLGKSLSKNIRNKRSLNNEDKKILNEYFSHVKEDYITGKSKEGFNLPSEIQKLIIKKGNPETYSFLAEGLDYSISYGSWYNKIKNSLSSEKTTIDGVSNDPKPNAELLYLYNDKLYLMNLDLNPQKAGIATMISTDNMKYGNSEIDWKGSIDEITSLVVDMRSKEKTLMFINVKEEGNIEEINNKIAHIYALTYMQSLAANSLRGGAKHD